MRKQLKRLRQAGTAREWLEDLALTLAFLAGLGALAVLLFTQ